MKLTKQEWLGKYKDKVSERNYKLLSLAYDILEENTLQGPDYPWGEYAVITPWLNGGGGIWNWDTAFHAMGVSRYDTGLAKSCLEGFMQFQKEDGMFPDVIAANGRDFVDDLSKPPFLPWAVMLTYRRDGEWDKDFLKRAYGRFVRNEAFMMRERQEGGLFYYSSQEDVEKDDYLHARWESGWDNSPRWDRPIIYYWAIDLNCAMVMTYRAMAEMAEELGKSADAELWKDKAESLSERIEERMFQEEKGYYADTDRRTGEHSGVLTPASFMPLYIGIASREHAEKMHLLAADERKFYPGMPTVAYDDPTYSQDYWRGPTWLNVAYFAVKGLQNYGYDKTAGEIREYLLNMIDKNSADGIFENYDSKEGKGLYWPHFSWSCAFTIQFILDKFDEEERKDEITEKYGDGEEN